MTDHKTHAETLLREITDDQLDATAAAAHAARAQAHATLHLAEVLSPTEAIASTEVTT
ncbi:hypothetical protein [Microbacterium kunmingense]|uniref:hypothetical protein n=1 Tax=Microbacterium kunmingense TaxID=2915939 RepID=UPI003D70AC41